MDRLTMLDTEIADTTAKTVYDAAVDMLGRVPHSYRVMMHSPLVLMTLLPFNAVMQREGAGSILTTKLKEMVVVKTSHVNGCEY
ncbi:MAG: hypothetical protein HOB79_13435 [Rhodospirillaceae bacterium]|jgi:hypothetical protein|nr:hypothetical protein [Rhodospirillales bacterium]MBT3904984.1 hypothetical protein [Rhodospirillaceae bacterium]MBT4702066.1 hypothetical protein [Rhodospirillaceae bacterium]MBT5034692.1 hypothetical protein [Rhodospirillaceae bacterium]MBT6222064.1 hypothetical protein [Rhodospirillaceae bacterium]